MCSFAFQCTTKSFNPAHTNCPFHRTPLAHVQCPSVGSPCVPLRSSFIYLFIYFMPVRRLARFVPLCGPFSKSAKLILILIEINEVIFFGHSPASCTTPPPIRFASSLWQMDFNLGSNPGHPWPTKCKTFQNQKCCRTASLYRFIIVCCAPSLAGGGVGVLDWARRDIFP